MSENIIFIKNQEFLFWTFWCARLAVEIHLRGKVVEAHSQEIDYGGTDILYPEEFFWLGANTDSKIKLCHDLYTDSTLACVEIGNTLVTFKTKQ